MTVRTFCLVIGPPPRSTRSDTLFPCTTLFLSRRVMQQMTGDAVAAAMRRRDFGEGAIHLPHRSHPGRHPDNRVLRQPLAINADADIRSEEHTSELQSLMRISYAVVFMTKEITNVEDNDLKTLRDLYMT